MLVGSVEGARSLALLAATRPERVAGLIAFAPSARGAAASSPDLAENAARAIAELTDWPGPLVEVYTPQWAADPVRTPAPGATSSRSRARSRPPACCACR